MDLWGVCDAKHGLKSNSLLSDVPDSSLLGTLANITKCAYVVGRKSHLIVLNKNTRLLDNKLERRNDLLRVRIVVGVLNQFENKVSEKAQSALSNKAGVPIEKSFPIQIGRWNSHVF